MADEKKRMGVLSSHSSQFTLEGYFSTQTFLPQDLQPSSLLPTSVQSVLSTLSSFKQTTNQTIQPTIQPELLEDLERTVEIPEMTVESNGKLSSDHAPAQKETITTSRDHAAFFETKYNENENLMCCSSISLPTTTPILFPQSMIPQLNNDHHSEGEPANPIVQLKKPIITRTWNLKPRPKPLKRYSSCFIHDLL